MPYLATFSYPGLDPTVIKQAAYSIRHGLTAEPITVTVPAGTAFPAQTGTAVFSYGPTTIAIQNCKFQLGQSSIGGSPEWHFAIMDGRWPFEFGEISGHWNITKPDNSIQPGTEKTPQQLATLCLQGMKVSQYDVSVLDNTRRPEVNWSSSNPAASLASLCDEMGCRPVWWIDGSVTICALGFGADLPDLPSQNIDFSFKTAAIPRAVKIVGAPTLFQCRWNLEAVGLDKDAIWKKLDDLSYKPATGWGQADPWMLTGIRQPTYATVQIPTEVQQIWDLAIKSVYHAYRLTTIVGTDKLKWVDQTKDPFDMTTLNSGAKDKRGQFIDDYYKHCLPLTQGLIDLEQTSEIEGGERKPLPAIVRGDFFDPRFNPLNNKQQRYHGGFGIDAQNGIVQFNEPLYLIPDDSMSSARVGEFFPANLNIEIAFHILDKNWAPVRPYWVFTLSGNSNVGNKIIETPETQFWAKTIYDSTNNITSTLDNRKKDNLDADANDLAAVYIKSLGAVPKGDKIYPGLVMIRLDGAIQNVTWSIGKIPTTHATINGEHDGNMNPVYYAQRRRAQREAAEKDIGRKAGLLLNQINWGTAEKGRTI